MKAMVILNEQHSLMPDQIRVLDEEFDEFELYPVPANGWALAEQVKHVRMLEDMISVGQFEGEIAIVFASPIPAMIKLCMPFCEEASSNTVMIFHNDHREKEELSNGKIIYKVAQTGWQLV